MVRAFVSAVVLACVLILAPTGKSEKEIGSASASPLTETMTDLLFATVREHPCAIIVMASNDPAVVPLPKPKPHVKAKVKKNKAHVPTKVKKKTHTHHHHHKHHSSDSSPKKISGGHGPLYLTSPPGCV